jgi:hypothetical protein
MEALAWMPDELGPSRENHIMRSSSVVSDVSYGAGRVKYTTFDAHAPAVDVLRLSYVPSGVTAGGRSLPISLSLISDGYTVQRLRNGDSIVTVRHDGERHLEVNGPDPQLQVSASALTYSAGWSKHADGSRACRKSGESVSYRFTGNQVRVLGSAGPDGGWADAYVDGAKQLTTVECWNPRPRTDQPIFIKKGLSTGPHEVRIVLRGVGSPVSKGSVVAISGVQTSAATGDGGFGSGEGPRSAQRMVFGYTGRNDIVDSAGHSWKPATEWVIRSGFSNDTVDKAWWTHRRSMFIGNTKDQELYRYGVHGKSFWANLTVAPGTYDLRLKFADTPLTAWMEREEKWARVLHSVQVFVNGKEAVPAMSISKEAGDIFLAVDKVIPNIKPEHGMIRVNFIGPTDREACVQALELVPHR